MTVHLNYSGVSIHGQLNPIPHLVVFYGLRSWYLLMEIFLCCQGCYLQSQPSKSSIPSARLCLASMPSSFGKSNVPKKKGVQVLSPNLLSPSTMLELLDAWDDEYNGIVIDSGSLPLTANTFASALRSSLLNWKLKVLQCCSSGQLLRHMLYATLSTKH